IENRRLAGWGNNLLTVDNLAKPSNVGWSETLSSNAWAHLAGNAQGADIGYCFLQRGDVKAVREARSGRLSDINSTYGPTTQVTRNYLTMWIDHGINPSNAT